MKIHSLKPWQDEVDSSSYASFIEQLKKCPAGEEIQLLVASRGGSVAYALSFYDIVTQSNLPLTTIGTGHVASSAIIVWLAGNRRLLTPHSTIFFHEISLTFADNACFDVTEMSARMRTMKIHERYITSIMTRRSGGKLNRIQSLDLMKNEAVLTPKQAMKLGLAHGITR